QINSKKAKTSKVFYITPNIVKGYETSSFPNRPKNRWNNKKTAFQPSARPPLLLTPKRKATTFAVINLIHSRLTPTQPFSK
ncbi:MAG: hypothetical protein LBK82_15240, partial [Planctomycetaceae bacterium]|nr:hypothetical protein [Planctomycetaceae bacterium]